IISWSGQMIVILTLISLFMILIVSDILYMLIPNTLLLFFSFLFIIEQLFFSLYSWNESLLGAVIGFGMLYLLCIISGGGIGGGDIKLYGIIGFVLGVQGVILSFMIACIIGSCAGIVGMMLGRIKR